MWTITTIVIVFYSWTSYTERGTNSFNYHFAIIYHTCTCTCISFDWLIHCIVDASPPNTYQPVDEKQRLVSASYVNYGPTTNNGVSDHLVREISHKPCDGSHEMLRSTLENGFKTLFPSIHQGLPASQLPSNQFSNSQSHHSSSEWPDLNTEKPATVNSKCTFNYDLAHAVHVDVDVIMYMYCIMKQHTCTCIIEPVN